MHLPSVLLLTLLASDPTDPAEAPRLPRPLLVPRWAPLPVPNHGPGTTGGGSSVLSGETLRRGAWSIELSSEWTEFESVSVAEAEAMALEHGHFDALGSSLVTSILVSYGLTDDLQLGIETGYYSGSDFIDAEDDGLGGVESAVTDPEGLMDTWLTARYRVSRGPSGHVSVLAGVKLPTGKDDEELPGGEVLEPSSQPGSGAVDYQAGVAYSRYLSPRVTLDASGVYTLRTEHDDFEVGDRADVGVAVAYRLTEDVARPHGWSVFGELNGTWLGEDEEDGVANDDSGGEVLYLGVGVRDRVNRNVAFSLVPSIPILQDVNGEQQENDWRVRFALELSL